MTNQKVLIPKNSQHPVSNIFQGENVASSSDVKAVKKAWVDTLVYAYSGMRFQPVLNVSPPDARGYKIQWLWNGQEISLSADGALYMPVATGLYANGIQARITNPDGSTILTDAMAVTVRPLRVVNEDRLTTITNAAPIQLKPIIEGMPVSYPVPGLTVKFTPQVASQITIDGNGLATLLNDVDQTIIINVDASYYDATFNGQWVLNQAVYYPLNSISLSSLVGKRVDDVFTVKATLNPTNATERALQWNSNPTGYLELVSQDDSALTATFKCLQVSSSPITIRATSIGKPGISGTTSLPAINEKLYPVQAVTINPASISGLRVGDSANLTAIITPDNASNKNGTWSSDDSSIMSVTGNGLSATIKALTAGSGTTIRFTSEDGGVVGTFVSGQIQPKPTPPAAIDLLSDVLDSRVTYTGGNVPYIDSSNVLKWSANDTWPLQYIDGVIKGRTLPELANVNRISKVHFEGAGVNNAAGSDNWRYSSSTNIAWDAVNGIDGGNCGGLPLWYNASRVLQDDTIIRALAASYDAFYNIVTRSSLQWQRGVLKFTISQPAATETRVDMAVNNTGNASDQLAWSYKETEPGDYHLTFFRRRNSNNDRWVYSVPQISKGAGGVGPLFGQTSSDAKIVVKSNSDVQTLRISLLNPSTGAVTTRDIPTNGATDVTINALGTDHWFQLIATNIEYIIP